MSNEKKIAFYTLGCKVNQYETEIIKRDFLENGYEETSFDNIADVYIVNTCTVTSVADKKNRNIIRRAKKINKNAQMIVTGCYAQTNSETLKEIKEIDYIIGNTSKEEIYNIVTKNISNYKVDNIFDEKEYTSKKYPLVRDKARAFVKIQDGCNKFCSYCKIPYARGTSRSRKKEDVITEINHLVSTGYKEIVLTGINLSEYGLDLGEKELFDDLIEEILDMEELSRLRISSVYPETLTEKFVNMLETNPKFMPHIHVSIQSLSDEVLKLMRRNYKADDIVSKLQMIESRIPNISITADIIVGFPQETEENFQETIDNVKKINFSDLHIFPYSDRDKTVASQLTGKIDNQVKKQRANHLEKIISEKREKFKDKQIGQEHVIYVEEIKDNKYFGYTENYIKVYVDLEDEKVKLTDLIKIKIKSKEKLLLKGEVI